MRLTKFVLIFILTLSIISAAIGLYFYKKLPVIDTNQAILILGIGGENHTASDLTDTIIVAYLNNNSKSIKFLSLPRDIWIAEIRAKLNSAYHYGGFKMAGDRVEAITNIPITNIVIVDFSLFKDLVDGMEGISVNIVNSFVDEKYPIMGKENNLCNGDKLYKCRFETIQFNQGKQQMNGEMALKFVRSRNAVGDEGTDIAREKRQQQVISAVREKLLSKKVLLNPKMIKNLYDISVAHVKTNIDQKKAIALLRFIFESRDNISFLTIPEEFLKISQNEKKYDRQYVFVPKLGTWKELQDWIAKII